MAEEAEQPTGLSDRAVHHVAPPRFIRNDTFNMLDLFSKKEVQKDKLKKMKSNDSTVRWYHSYHTASALPQEPHCTEICYIISGIRRVLPSFKYLHKGEV